MDADRESLSEMLYEELREAVISGQWPVGMRINEKELAQQKHVSRTPIRYALARIYKEGLLDYSKHLGYRVRIVTKEDVEEIYKIRQALEILAATEAADKMAEEDFQEVQDLIDHSKRAIQAGDTEALIQYSGLFNRMLFLHAKMPRLNKIYEGLSEYLKRFRSYSFGDDKNYADRRKEAVFEHDAILKAMRSGDRELISLLVTEHNTRSKVYLLSVLPDYVHDEEYEEDLLESGDEEL